MPTDLFPSGAIRRHTLHLSCVALAALSTIVIGGEVDQVVERTKPAIIRIEVLTEEGSGGRMIKQRGFGSGAIIDADGHVITNHHVAGRGTRFRVTLADRDHGLMLVKPSATTETPRPALVPDAAQDHPPAFTEVLCLGRLPAAFGHQPTATVIRTTGPLAARHGLDPLAEADQGALGCAVVDAEGTFLGITTIPMSADKTNPAMHDLGLYVIPASSLHRLAEAHTK